jgi:electron transport complex protein RnfG
MSLSTRMVLVLTLVGLITGGFLAGVAKLTKEKIALNIQKEIEEAIIKAVPGTTRSQKLYEEEDLIVYEGKNDAGQPTGYAVQATGIGFQDKITLLYGIDLSGTKIIGLTIIDQKETPGLGAKITDRDVFLRFWKNRSIERPLTLRKPPVPSPEDLAPSEVNAITGATISSTRVLEIVNFSLDRLKELRQEGKLAGEKNGS